MGKTFQANREVYSGMGPRSAFCLAAILGVWFLLPLYTVAESETGLVINKEGGNVNVSLDSEASANVSIRRSEDTMVIRLPKSFNPKLVIDPALQKESVVQETESAEGRTITIHSQQIYLMTREHLEAPSAPVPKSRTSDKTATTKATVKTKQSGSTTGTGHEDGLHEAVNTLAIQEDVQPVSMNGQAAKMPAAEKSAVLTGNASAQKSEQALKEAIEDLKRQTSGSSGSMEGEGKPADTSTEGQASDDAKGNPAKPSAQPPSESKANPGDPESQPLNMDENTRAQAVHTSTGSLLRIVLSLLGVLALFVGFVRVVLPRLMDRYPEFFENLKRQSEQKAQRNAFFTETGKEQWPLKSDQRRESRFFAPANSETVSKKNYLERMNMNGDHFNVLTSTSLGKGKELHLVEIRGRQFMVATTPYTVTLLKDLTDESEPGSALEPSIASLPSIPSLMDESLRAGESRFAGDVPQRSETVAYVSESHGSVPPKSNPYASVPASSRPGLTRQAPQAAHADEVYLKYLNPASPVRPSSPVGQGYTPPAGSSSLQPPYVDAEEVVVLEDYDDTYGF